VCSVYLDVTGREFRAVFISVVHTRHYVESEAAQCTGNFGFLHEQKLLNTALSRAKSWLAVVADPVVLCTVGSCSPIWRKYLKRCFHLRSVQPSHLSLTDIYNQSRELLRMNEISLSKWSTDFALAPDEIIQRLGAKDKPTATNTNTSITYRYASADTESEYESDFTNDSDETDEEECDDVAADGNAQDTDEDEAALSERLLETEPEMYKRCKLDIKLANLAHAVVCDDHSKKIVISGRRQFGRALHGDEVVVQITATAEENRRNDNTDAYTQDDDESLSEGDTEDSGDCVFDIGLVVGILKRVFNPINRTFICRRDDNNCRNMIPLDVRIPIIRIRFCRDHNNTQQTDVVCVLKNQQWKHTSISCRSQLFKVKVDRWEKQNVNPLGHVVASVQNTVEKEIDVLEETCGVRKSFSEDAQKQAEQISEKISHKVEEDYRKKLVLTIDESEAKVLDDALSVEMLDDGYLFGIHIADVSARVPQDSPIDEDARKRGLVFNPVGREHRQMLPEKLSVEVCSLLPGEDRPTVSVFVHTDSKYKIQEDLVVIKRCQIRSRHQLTYEGAEELIAQEETNDPDLSWSIHRLKEAAICWRRERLGNDKCYRPPKMMSMNCITARTLVEEMMIKANFQVATKLVGNVPCRSPLRHKLLQSHVELKSLNNRSVDVSDLSCLATAASDHMQLSLSMLIALSSAAKSNDMELIRCLVTNIEYQPQLALESVKLNQQNTRAKAKYICSGNERNWEHCGLKLAHYAHFTSPLRRYIDIVVHRMLLSVIDAEPNTRESDGYSTEDIAEICDECNDAKSKARRLKYGSCSIRLCSLLRERSVVIYAVVCTITDSHISLLFPNLQSVLSTTSAVKFSSLKPSMLPERIEKAVTLRWQQRIYDVSGSKEMRSTNSRVVALDPHQYLVQVKADDWKELVHAVTDENKVAITEAVKALYCPEDDQSKKRIQNLTSEGYILQSGKYYCEYSATFARTCVVKVQLAAADGYHIQPHIQLFHLTPLMCICVEHNTGAVECFSKPAMNKAVANEYNDIGHYQKLWLPVLAVEAAYSAVANGHSVIVHNVDIHWKQRGSKYTGTFEIATKFCKERNITFPVDEEPAMYDNYAKGYMCVRYASSLKPVIKKASAVDTFKGVIEVDKPFTWVGHCVVTRVIISLDKTYYVIHLLLKHNTCSLPEQRNTATIEWIPKLVPDR